MAPLLTDIFSEQAPKQTTNLSRIFAPPQVGPFENFLNAAYKSAVPYTAASYQALLGIFNEDYRRRGFEAMQRADIEHPTRPGVSSFLGSAVGGIAPTVGAVLFPPAVPAVLLHYGMTAMGQAQTGIYEYEKRTGGDVPWGTEMAVTLGYGAAVYFAERLLGARFISKKLNDLSRAGAKTLGEAVANRNMKELAKAAVKTGLWEGTEEAFEQVAQNVFTAFYDQDRKLGEGLISSFAMGAVGGSFLAPIKYAQLRLQGYTSPEIEARDVKEGVDPTLSIKKPRLDAKISYYVTPEGVTFEPSYPITPYEKRAERLLMAPTEEVTEVARERAPEGGEVSEEGRVEEREQEVQRLRIRDVAQDKEEAQRETAKFLKTEEEVREAFRAKTTHQLETDIKVQQFQLANLKNLSEENKAGVQERIDWAKEVLAEKEPTAEPKEAEWQQIVEEGGGAWTEKSGLWSPGFGPDLVMFDEPVNHTSVTLPVKDMSVENVERKIEAKQAEYAKAEAAPVTKPTITGLETDISDMEEWARKENLEAQSFENIDRRMNEISELMEQADELNAESLAKRADAVWLLMQPVWAAKGDLRATTDAEREQFGRTEEEMYQRRAERTIPISAEKVIAQVQHASETGLADFLFHTEQLTDAEGNPVNAIYSDKLIHLSPEVEPSSVGHELFHAVKDQYGNDRRLKPLIAQGEKEFGGEEGLAEVVGRYYADDLDAGLTTRVGDWLKRFWAKVRQLFGRQLSGEQVARLLVGKLNRRYGEPGRVGVAAAPAIELARQFQRAKFQRRAVPGPHNDTEAGKFYAMQLDAKGVQLTKDEFSSWLSKFSKRAKVRLVDTSATIKGELLDSDNQHAKWAELLFTHVPGAYANAEIRGSKAGKDIWGGLKEDMRQLLFNVAQAQRVIVVESHPQHYNIGEPGGIRTEEAREFLQAVPAEVMKELEPRLDAWQRQMDEIIDARLAGGFITEEEAEAMRAAGPFYVPRWFLDKIDAKRTSTFGGRRISVTDSGFRYLEDGDIGILENNMELMLTVLWARTIAADYMNRANKNLLQFAQEDPDNGIVIAPELETVEEEGEEPRIRERLSVEGFTPLGIKVDGETRHVLMKEPLAKEWATGNAEAKSELLQFFRVASGSPILKATATGYNPGFAITNFFRDIMHAWLVTKEFSPNFLKAMWQFGGALKATKASAWNAGRKTGVAGIDWFHLYMDMNGGMSFLTHQGKFNDSKIVNKLVGADSIRELSKLQDAMSKLGEFSEIWVRLAIMKQALGNMEAEGRSLDMESEEGLMNVQEAVGVARSYLDFGVGGSLAKAVDSGIPYLNAGIQGSRGVFRAAKQDPKTFLLKVAQIGALSSGLLLANRRVNRRAWEDISDEEKTNYFIITSPFSYTDKKGNLRHMYIRIAKDQGQRAFATLFEGATMLMQGEEFPTDRLVKAIGEALPITPDGSMLPPLMKGLLGYIYNKDFWRNEDIWKGAEVESKGLEYTNYTNPAFVKVGEATGLSPERMRYVVDQLFARGNVYSAVVGGGFRALADELPGNERDETVQEVIANIPVLRRVYRTTYPDIMSREEVEGLRLESNDRLVRQRREFDIVANEQVRNPTTETRRVVRQFIVKQPPQDRKKLQRRLLWYIRTANIPNRRWWLDVASLDPETRALAYYGRLESALLEERPDLESTARRIPGFRTIRFRRALAKLQARPKSEPSQGQPSLRR